MSIHYVLDRLSFILSEATGQHFSTDLRERDIAPLSSQSRELPILVELGALILCFGIVFGAYYQGKKLFRRTKIQQGYLLHDHAPPAILGPLEIRIVIGAPSL